MKKNRAGVPLADQEVRLHGEEQPHRAGRAVAEEGRLRGRQSGPLWQHGADQQRASNSGRRGKRENSNEAEGVVGDPRGRGRELEGAEEVLAHFVHGDDQVGLEFV